MLIALPFTTFDEVRDLGLAVTLYCSRCRREVAIDLDDPRLGGKSFAAGVRFVCTNMVKHWDAHPAEVCGTSATVTVRPPRERRILPGQAILHCAIGCPRCVPGWSIKDVRRDDPLWKPLFERKARGFRCPTCGARLVERWNGWGGVPHTDGYRRSA